MLKAYLSVIHASLILADTRGYHTQLSTVTSYIDMISVIFIKGKLLKLHAPMSIHTTSISPVTAFVEVFPVTVVISLIISFWFIRPLLLIFILGRLTLALHSGYSAKIIQPALAVFDVFELLWEHLAGCKNLKKC